MREHRARLLELHEEGALALQDRVLRAHAREDAVHGRQLAALRRHIAPDLHKRKGRALCDCVATFLLRFGTLFNRIATPFVRCQRRENMRKYEIVIGEKTAHYPMPRSNVRRMLRESSMRCAEQLVAEERILL